MCDNDKNEANEEYCKILNDDRCNKFISNFISEFDTIKSRTKDDNFYEVIRPPSPLAAFIEYC